DVGSSSGDLHHAPSGHGIFNPSRSIENFCRHHARLGNAPLRDANRSKTHDSLWRCHHARQLDFSDFLSALTSAFFFFKDTAPTEIYTLSLHDALPMTGEWA